MIGLSDVSTHTGKYGVVSFNTITCSLYFLFSFVAVFAD